MSEDVEVSGAAVESPAGAAVFVRYFAEAPDLARFSYAARRILATSAALFYRQGAVGTSIRDITKACGLTPGAFYNHFASRDDVLDVLVRHGHDALEARIAAALDAADADPGLQLAAFVRAYVLGHLVHPELAQLVRREYVHLSPPRHAAIVRRRRALRTRLSRMLRAGAAGGAFDLPGGAGASTRVAVMVLDMCSRTSEWYDPSRAESPERLAERYVVAALRLAGAGG